MKGLGKILIEGRVEDAQKYFENAVGSWPVAEPGNPDGITVDDNGNIYQTLPGIGAIAVLNDKGEMIEIYHMESWKPSNIHFTDGIFYVTDRLGSRIFKFTK